MSNIKLANLLILGLRKCESAGRAYYIARQLLRVKNSWSYLTDQSVFQSHIIQASKRFYVVQKCRWTNFEDLTLWKAQSGKQKLALAMTICTYYYDITTNKVMQQLSMFITTRGYNHIWVAGTLCRRGHPTEKFIIVVPQNLWIDSSELHEIRRSTDCEALKFGNIW